MLKIYLIVFKNTSIIVSLNDHYLENITDNES